MSIRRILRCDWPFFFSGGGRRRSVDVVVVSGGEITLSVVVRVTVWDITSSSSATKMLKS